jgi:hypothetical protein
LKRLGQHDQLVEYHSPRNAPRGCVRSNTRPCRIPWWCVNYATISA